MIVAAALAAPTPVTTPSTPSPFRRRSRYPWEKIDPIQLFPLYPVLEFAWFVFRIRATLEHRHRLLAELAHLTRLPAEERNPQSRLERRLQPGLAAPQTIFAPENALLR